MASVIRFLVVLVAAAAQKLVPFDGAAASSQYSSHSFAADLALGESSGRVWLRRTKFLQLAENGRQNLARYWCSAG